MDDCPCRSLIWSFFTAKSAYENWLANGRRKSVDPDCLECMHDTQILVSRLYLNSNESKVRYNGLRWLTIHHDLHVVVVWDVDDNELEWDEKIGPVVSLEWDWSGMKK